MRKRSDAEVIRELLAEREEMLADIDELRATVDRFERSAAASSEDVWSVFLDEHPELDDLDG